MDINTKLQTKKEKKDLILKKYFSIKNKIPLGLIKLSNKSLIKDLRDGLISLPANFILEISDANNEEKLGKNFLALNKIKDAYLNAFDFIICDNEISGLNKYFQKGITPIIIKDNEMVKFLKDFNPMKNEGNAFLFDKLDKWCIFYSLVRYIENYKFPFDNKNLVKNVFAI